MTGRQCENPGVNAETAAAGRLLVEDRRAHILNDLHRDGRVYSGELSRRFGVSEDAIRRDLRDLASLGLLKRVHGGALPLSNALEPYAIRNAQQHQSKKEVAFTFARWVSPNQVVFIDGGSTLTEVIRHLPGGLGLTIITNNLHAAVELAERADVHGILLGGVIDTASHITSGLRAVEDVSSIHADLCLLGVCSLHPEHGLTTPNHEEAQLKRAMIRQSAECAVVLTADKLGTISTYAVAPISDIDLLFVDSQVPAEQLGPYRDCGVQVVQ